MVKTLGQILVEKNVISKSQLELALSRQRKQAGKYLGQILIEMGLVSQEDLNKLLNVFDKRKRIGEVLIDLRVITPHQLTDALRKQREMMRRGKRKTLGTVVLELGYASYDNYLKAVSRHFNMPVVSLGNFFPTPALQRTLGENYAWKNIIIVLENTPGRVNIALAEPTHSLLEEIQKAVSQGKTLEFYLASPYEVDSCLRKKFGPLSVTRSP